MGSVKKYIRGVIVVKMQWERRLLSGIITSFTRRKIRKCQKRLGNGHDPELHLTIADLYGHLGEKTLALASYRAAASCLLKTQTPLDTRTSDQLIKIYKQILTLSPFDEEMTNKLGQEYKRRGNFYKAATLYTSLAEHYVQRGEYKKAIHQYHRVFEIEPSSISTRKICADLYCQIGDSKSAAREYSYIGDIYFDHQKFDGAQQYYQQAASLDPEDDEIKHKTLITKQILEDAVIPQVQESLRKLYKISDSFYLKRSLQEKERVEQELRRNLHLLKQRYQQSVALKSQQLRKAQERLEELSTYVAALKDNLEQVESAKQDLKAQLDQELAHKRNLEHQLGKLAELRVSDGTLSHIDDQAVISGEYIQRIESAVTRLKHQKIKLETDLHDKLEASLHQETKLRNYLDTQSSQGEDLEHQIVTITQERERIEHALQRQLQESLDRENVLREQIKKLISQHTHALRQVECEKCAYEEKCRTTQTRMNIAEQHNMVTLEQLHDELSRQCEIECNFSEEFHESLQEIAQLLHAQEREIQALEHL